MFLTSDRRWRPAVPARRRQPRESRAGGCRSLSAASDVMPGSSTSSQWREGRPAAEAGARLARPSIFVGVDIGEHPWCPGRGGVSVGCRRQRDCSTCRGRTRPDEVAPALSASPRLPVCRYRYGHAGRITRAEFEPATHGATRVDRSARLVRTTRSCKLIDVARSIRRNWTGKSASTRPWSDVGQAGSPTLRKPGAPADEPILAGWSPARRPREPIPARAPRRGNRVGIEPTSVSDHHTRPTIPPSSGCPWHRAVGETPHVSLISSAATAGCAPTRSSPRNREFNSRRALGPVVGDYRDDQLGQPNTGRALVEGNWYCPSIRNVDRRPADPAPAIDDDVSPTASGNAPYLFPPTTPPTGTHIPPAARRTTPRPAAGPAPPHGC